MLGAVAAGVYPDLHRAMPAMSRVATSCPPDPASAGVHDIRYAAFLQLQQAARDIRQSMAGLAG